MQNNQRILKFKKNINKQFYNSYLKNFADWTSNAQTGEVVVRHVRQSFGLQNAYYVFNRSRDEKSSFKQSIFKNDMSTPQKDFPSNTNRLSYLMGRK